MIDRLARIKPSFVIEGTFFLVIIGLSLYLQMTLILNGTAVTPDSIRYLDVSQNISDGFGVVESTYSLGPDKFKPLTVWPPLYPYILSFFNSPYTSGSVEAARLSFIILPTTIILIYLLLKKITSKTIAFLFSILFLLSHPILTVFSYAWSETLFIPLLLCALITCMLSIKYSSEANSPKHKIFLTIFTISIIALSYCRFIGIIFFIFIPLAFFLSKNKKLVIVHYIISCLLYVIFVGFMLTRNFFLTGFFGGGGRKEAWRGLYENIGDFFDALQVQFLFSFGMLWLSIFFVLALIFIKYLIRSKSLIDHNIYLEGKKNLTIISVIGLISYLAALLILRSIVRFDVIDTRLISPIWPFIIILLTLVFSYGWYSRFTIYSILILASSLFLIFPILNQHYEVYNNALINLKNNKAYLGFYSNSKTPYHDFRGRDMIPLALENMIYDLKKIDDIDLLITETPKDIQFLSGIRSRKFPPGKITDVTIKLINKSSKRGFILLRNQYVIYYLNSYYGFNHRNLKFNSDLYKNYKVLLVPLPLPLMQ